MLHSWNTFHSKLLSTIIWIYTIGWITLQTIWLMQMPQHRQLNILEYTDVWSTSLNQALIFLPYTYAVFKLIKFNLCKFPPHINNHFYSTLFAAYLGNGTYTKFCLWHTDAMLHTTIIWNICKAQFINCHILIVGWNWHFYSIINQRI